MDPVHAAFLGLAVLSFLLGVASLAATAVFARRVRASVRRTWAPFAPPAAVLVACRGVDAGLAENLASLLHQDYGTYRVVFALDRLDDPAHAVIREAAAEARVPVSVVAADPLPNCTGKAAALIRAAKEIGPADGIVALMDSDARPPEHWLRALVAPLQDAGIGATTTYRWYAHEDLAGAVRSAWNAAGTSILFSDRLNFAWGGSTAMRRETFERTYVAAKWRTALSDDMVLTQAVKGAGLRVAYVPGATVVTEEPASWRATLEWTTRQAVMMRAYDRRVVRRAALAYASVTGSVYLGLGLLAIAAFADPSFLLPAGLLLSQVPLLAANAAARLATYRRVTGYDLGPVGAFLLGSLVTPWLSLYNLNAARRLRVISWRGNLYELSGSPPLRVVRR